MKYDGGSDERALVDNVVDLQISYFGDPNPPLKPKPAPGDANCLYDSTGNYIGPGVLPTVDGSLAALTPAMLTDGPFCGGGSNQFDAGSAARAQGAHDGPTPGGECSVARHGPDALAESWPGTGRPEARSRLRGDFRGDASKSEPGSLRMLLWR